MQFYFINNLLILDELLLSELIEGRILEFLQFLLFHKILLMNFTKILLLSQ